VSFSVRLCAFAGAGSLGGAGTGSAQPAAPKASGVVGRAGGANARVAQAAACTCNTWQGTSGCGRMRVRMHAPHPGANPVVPADDNGGLGEGAHAVLDDNGALQGAACSAVGGGRQQFVNTCRAG
jgi:hypothetical protein